MTSNIKAMRSPAAPDAVVPSLASGCRCALGSGSDLICSIYILKHTSTQLSDRLVLLSLCQGAMIYHKRPDRVTFRRFIAIRTEESDV